MKYHWIDIVFLFEMNLQESLNKTNQLTIEDEEVDQIQINEFDFHRLFASYSFPIQLIRLDEQRNELKIHWSTMRLVIDHCESTNDRIFYFVSECLEWRERQWMKVVWWPSSTVFYERYHHFRSLLWIFLFSPRSKNTVPYTAIWVDAILWTVSSRKQRIARPRCYGIWCSVLRYV